MARPRLSIWSRIRSAFGTTGWRRAALVNTTIMGVSTLILISFLIAALAQARGIYKTVMFYSGACGSSGASRANLALHLLLNIFSTAIFASSNFFMQVLNAPSRDEVVEAHSRGSWLDIGIPSLRNAVRVSRFKTLSWAVFFLSSIPLHLFFNSVIFQTDRRESSYQLTIATEGFVNGGPYRVPGTSLVIPDSDSSDTYLGSDAYLEPKSPVSANISSVAAEGSTWNQISAAKCRNEYEQCHGLQKYRNVVIVIDQPDGWTTTYPTNYSTSYISADFFKETNGSINSLWYSAQCVMEATFQSVGFTEAPQCDNACQNRLQATADSSEETWKIDFQFDDSQFVQSQFVPLPVSYCLAESIQPGCKIGLSVMLLLAITLCTTIKFVQCLVVLKGLDYRQSLVTLGDAVTAFIREPDPHTVGQCTLSRTGVRRSQRTLAPGPRRWHQRPRRMGSAVSKRTWICTYVIYIVCLFPVCFCLWIAGSFAGILTGTVGQSDSNFLIRSRLTSGFLSATLLVNSPQLILSFCYLSYNTLFTRMQMAREWAMYSMRYKGLRVTEPTGSQFATYRLQLPYKYSIPLITGSVLLHWMMSNTFYVVVFEGDYFKGEEFQEENAGILDDSLGADTQVSFGYSPISILAFIIIFLVITLAPCILGVFRLPGYMRSVGSNSWAISAACHVSAMSKAREQSLDNLSPSERESVSSLLHAPDTDAHLYSDANVIQGENRSDLAERALILGGYSQTHNDDIEMRSIRHASSDSLHIDPAPDESVFREMKGSDDELRLLISQNKIKWGVVPMPPGFLDQYASFEDPVGHLGFGVAADDVGVPIEDWYYA
ncbi:hypothetical protein PFICI_04937 [Pestalotiopsis fici W106-1]|uniref:DUF6536 domain-containing protein n=1 Tax=Pestalotiopsis fici (strain W106-1 / CGMCC3.15140) TaxID=1229662 RepID=W3XD01_PESFW|nr:uncharacterized protein PFICI_04937 [Pestalotiopsis fici W106-1]ETS83061.1 hypothetical protein PFICI_04937 [Pestalotiopsis fici W106-1]